MWPIPVDLFPQQKEARILASATTVAHGCSPTHEIRLGAQLRQALLEPYRSLTAVFAVRFAVAHAWDRDELRERVQHRVCAILS